MTRHVKMPKLGTLTRPCTKMFAKLCLVPFTLVIGRIREELQSFTLFTCRYLVMWRILILLINILGRFEKICFCLKKFYKIIHYVNYVYMYFLFSRSDKILRQAVISRPQIKVYHSVRFSVTFQVEYQYNIVLRSQSQIEKPQAKILSEESLHNESFHGSKLSV